MHSKSSSWPLSSNNKTRQSPIVKLSSSDISTSSKFPPFSRRHSCATAVAVVDKSWIVILFCRCARCRLRNLESFSSNKKKTNSSISAPCVLSSRWLAHHCVLSAHTISATKQNRGRKKWRTNGTVTWVPFKRTTHTHNPQPSLLGKLSASSQKTAGLISRWLSRPCFSRFQEKYNQMMMEGICHPRWKFIGSFFFALLLLFWLLFCNSDIIPCHVDLNTHTQIPANRRAFNWCQMRAAVSDCWLFAVQDASSFRGRLNRVWVVYVPDVTGGKKIWLGRKSWIIMHSLSLVQYEFHGLCLHGESKKI